MTEAKKYTFTIVLSFSAANLKYFLNQSFHVMDMTMVYKGKCDKCNRENPKLYVKVYRDRGDGVSSEMAWCLECVRNAGLF